MFHSYKALLLFPQVGQLTKCRSECKTLHCLPDIQGAFLIGSQGPGPGAHAVVHHLLSQVMDFGLKSSVVWELKQRWQIWFCSFRDLEMLHSHGSRLPCHWFLCQATVRCSNQEEYTCLIFFIHKYSQEEKRNPLLFKTYSC